MLLAAETAGFAEFIAEVESMSVKKVSTSVIVFICLLLAAFLLKAYVGGKFHSVQSLQEYVGKFGAFAPVILVIIQAVQVVIPVLPGFLGCVVGAVLFGSAGGFWCNYIGISLGSLIAFLLAKKYGIGLVQNIFPRDKYEKYSEWAGKSRSYTVLLFLGMVLPLFPDDFFCYFSGLTKMGMKKFTAIIVLGKPWCILAYSIAFAKFGGL